MPTELAAPEISATLDGDLGGEEPWRDVLRPPADSRRLLAARSAWAVLALASGDDRLAARVADGLSRPEASRARARLEAEGLLQLLPLLMARAGRAWCVCSDAEAIVEQMRADPRLAFTGAVGDTAWPQAYVRAVDLPQLVDAYALDAHLDQHADQAGDQHIPSAAFHEILLRPVAEPWPLPEAPAAVPDLVRALDVLELAVERAGVHRAEIHAAWTLIHMRADAAVPSWHRARRPPRVRSAALRLGHRAASPFSRALAATRAADADLLSALLFAAGTPVSRSTLQVGMGWQSARLQAAVDALVAEPPRGQQVLLLDDERLQLVTAAAASGQVERLLRHLKRDGLPETLELPETVWLVMVIVVLEQPITRTEITARRMADSDRQVQILLRHRLVREEPRAAVPGRGIPLVTTDLVLRRFGLRSIAELQDYLLTHAQGLEEARLPFLADGFNDGGAMNSCIHESSNST
ncbi:MAG: SMC-Scp complex subunit ScpB [Chloroflexi bacterium]|nr:SMC-Scp complex subunit ScpB [Chloroflexota bacterium]